MRARDASGNTEAASSRTFTYDTTTPQTTIDSSPSDPTSSTSADFDLSANEVGSTFECRLDGGAWGACASPAGYTSLTDGNHTFDVRAADPAGNTDGSPASYTWLVDTAAPFSTIAFPAASGEYNAAGWNAGCATSGTCGAYGDASGSGVDQVQVSVRRVSTGLYWNGAAFSAAAETFFSASLAGGDWSRAFPASSFPADGDYTVRAFATDEAGNAETPMTRTFGFDATDPTGSLTAPADGSFVTGTLGVSSDSTDPGSGVDEAEFQRRPAGGGAWITIDTDSNAPYSVNWDTTPLADGDYDLRVLTTDAAGNTFTSPLRTVTVDNSAPSAPVVTLSESGPYAHVSGSEIFVNTDETGSYDVEAASSDAHSGIDKIRFPGPTDDSSSPYSASYGLSDLAGAQTVTAFNGAGLTASSPFTVTPDTTEPTGGSVDYPNGYDADGDVTISLDAGTDALSGIAAGSAVLERRTAPLADGTCDPFAGAWSAVTSPNAVASGLCAQYRYRVSDRVGNEAVSTSSNVVKVDLVAPSAPVLT
ncbi:MAG: Ig-like domain-containing protein, partial [Candidatus Rokuibacteriota bacterium]